MKQVETPLSVGSVGLPILYTDASVVCLFWRVDPKAAAPLVDPAVEPMVIGGQAIAALCVFEYRSSTVGVYNELGLGIQVKKRGTSPSVLGLLKDIARQKEQGLYVLNLPVTTEAAFNAGVELWGYPKYVTGIETAFEQQRVRATLEGEITLEMKRGIGLSTKGMPIVTITNKDGRLIRTVIEVDHRIRFGGASSVVLDVIGDGPTARNIKALGLHKKGALAAYRTDQMRSVLPLGEDIGEAGASGPAVRAA